MSHGDKVTKLPDGFVGLAKTANAEHVAIGDAARKIWGLQFHPEVPKSAALSRTFAPSPLATRMLLLLLWVLSPLSPSIGAVRCLRRSVAFAMRRNEYLPTHLDLVFTAAASVPPRRAQSVGAWRAVAAPGASLCLYLFLQDQEFCDDLKLHLTLSAARRSTDRAGAEEVVIVAENANVQRKVQAPKEREIERAAAVVTLVRPSARRLTCAVRLAQVTHTPRGKELLANFVVGAWPPVFAHGPLSVAYAFTQHVGYGCYACAPCSRRAHVAPARRVRRAHGLEDGRPRARVGRRGADLWHFLCRLEVFPSSHPLPFILARWRSHRRSSCHGSYRERSLRGLNWCARGACRRHARHAISARARCHGSDILCFRRLLARHAIFARLRENRPSAAETNADPRATDEAPPNSREGMFHELVLHKQAAALVGPTAHVIGAVSGGVDSTVAATLMHEARGEGF
jgi:hypothetical protein